MLSHLLLLGTLAFGTFANAQMPSKPWTVLVYWAVDNDLYDFSIPYLKSFEKIASDKNVNIVVHYDYPNGRPTERILIQPGQSTLLQLLPVNQNSADPKTLAQFISWGMTTFPSKYTSLVIGSHGSNWSGVIQDDGTKQYMSLSQFKSALSRIKIDLLLFDTCRMSFLETLYALAGSASYLVGSPFDLNGFDHEVPLDALTNKPGMSPDELARRYVYAYPYRRENRNQPGMVASSFNLNQDYSKFAKSVDAEIRAINQLSNDAKTAILNSVAVTKNEDSDIAVDLYELLEKAGKQNWVKGYPKNKWILATGTNYESGFHSGLSITCASKIEAYKTSGLGTIMPEWSKLCEFWINGASGDKSK